MAKKKLTPKLEDYLEVVHQLVDRKGAARVRDVAEMLSVHKSSVTAALRRLGEKGLVDYAPYELTTLTPRGEALARDVRRRHRVIARFLTEVLSVEADLAEANACRLEHAIDPDVLERLLTFIDFVHQAPPRGTDWHKEFDGYLKKRDRGAPGPG